MPTTMCCGCAVTRQCRPPPAPPRLAAQSPRRCLRSICRLPVTCNGFEASTSRVIGILEDPAVGSLSSERLLFLRASRRGRPPAAGRLGRPIDHGDNRVRWADTGNEVTPDAAASVRISIGYLTIDCLAAGCTLALYKIRNFL